LALWERTVSEQMALRRTRWIAIACALWVSCVAYAAAPSKTVTGSSAIGSTATITWKNPAPYPYQVNLQSSDGCVTDAGNNSFTVDPESKGGKPVSYTISVNPNCSAKAMSITWKYSTKTGDGWLSRYSDARTIEFDIRNLTSAGAQGRVKIAKVQYSNVDVAIAAYCDMKSQLSKCNHMNWSGGQWEDPTDWFDLTTLNLTLVPGNPATYVMGKNGRFKEN
jgi:hypothetical protein